MPFSFIISILIVEDHFVDVDKMVEIGSGAERVIEDIQLSRYACYLIVQNVACKLNSTQKTAFQLDISELNHTFS